MNNLSEIEKTFCELIQVAIGTRICLSHTPNEDEWGDLYEIARKQSLIGVCFVGVQKLQAQKQCPQEVLFLQWMGISAKIQQRNEVVNSQCVELQTMLADDGFRSCILKGQSNLANYDIAGLSMLRQSGDIDVWVDAPKETIVAYIQGKHPTEKVREHHIAYTVFADTEVEVHFWPAVIRHFVKNSRLQKWFREHREQQFMHRTTLTNSMTIFSPTPEFNTIQQLAHMYHHLFENGLGLRQVFDFYFVLNNLKTNNTSTDSMQVDGDNMLALSRAINYIGMGRFASAMMWVLQEVMELEREKMVCEPNKDDGEFLLKEIFLMGNFGHNDRRKTRDISHFFSSFYGSIFRNMRYLRFNPFDWFWSPLWRLYYFCWRKWHRYH